MKRPGSEADPSVAVSGVVNARGATSSSRCFKHRNFSFDKQKIKQNITIKTNFTTYYNLFYKTSSSYFVP